jgi:hypothetical protein
MGTIPQTSQAPPWNGWPAAVAASSSPADIARSVMCSLCWTPPGTPCQCNPAGSHLARYCDAERRGVLGREDLAAIVGQLEVIAGHVIILDVTR